MDNSSDLIDLVASRVWLGDRWRHSPDSSSSGNSSDRPRSQPGLWPTSDLGTRRKELAQEGRF